MSHYLGIYFWIIKESFWKSILSVMAAANKILRRTPERMLLCHNSVMSGWTKSKELSCLNTAFCYDSVGHYCWWKEFTVFTLTQLTPLTFVFSHVSAVYPSFQLVCLGRDGVRKTIYSTGIHTTSLLLNYQDVHTYNLLSPCSLNLLLVQLNRATLPFNSSPSEFPSPLPQPTQLSYQLEMFLMQLMRAVPLLPPPPHHCQW